MHRRDHNGNRSSHDSKELCLSHTACYDDHTRIIVFRFSKGHKKENVAYSFDHYIGSIRYCDIWCVISVKQIEFRVKETVCFYYVVYNVLASKVYRLLKAFDHGSIKVSHLEMGETL